jgi:predicted glycoside hydrolase/deacetylase ChbG (UPF0249 family)
MVRIVADDYGLDSNVDNAVLELLELGVIHGTSIMILSPVIKMAGKQYTLNAYSTGLHIDLTHFKSINLSIKNSIQIFLNVKSQIKIFSQVFGRLPDHIDSHQNVHRKIHIFLILHILANFYGIARVRSIVDFNVDTLSYSPKNKFKMLLELPFSKKIDGHILRSKAGSLGIIPQSNHWVHNGSMNFELPVHPSIGLLSVASKLNSRRINEYKALKRLC